MRTYDFSTIKKGDTGAWQSLMAAMNQGNLCMVPDWVFDYFLNVLPPRKMFRGGFQFAEGEDPLTTFVQINGTNWAMRTPDADHLAGLVRHYRKEKEAAPPPSDLVRAARQVVDCWESGDLAAAVRSLAAELEKLPAAGEPLPPRTVW